MSGYRVEFTTEQAAVIAGTTAVVIRQWVSRGRIRRTPRGKIDGESLSTYLAKRGR